MSNKRYGSADADAQIVRGLAYVLGSFHKDEDSKAKLEVIVRHSSLTQKHTAEVSTYTDVKKEIDYSINAIKRDFDTDCRPGIVEISMSENRKNATIDFRSNF